MALAATDRWARVYASARVPNDRSPVQRARPRAKFRRSGRAPARQSLRSILRSFAAGELSTDTLNSDCGLIHRSPEGVSLSSFPQFSGNTQFLRLTISEYAISAHLRTQFLRMRNFGAGRPCSASRWNLGADFREQKTLFRRQRRRTVFVLLSNCESKRSESRRKFY